MRIEGSAGLPASGLTSIIGAPRTVQSPLVDVPLLDCFAWPRSSCEFPFNESSDRVRFLVMNELRHIIPKPDYRLGQIVLVAKRAQARSAQHEVSASQGFQPQPTRSQHPQKVPVRKNQNVVPDRAHSADHTIGARTNLGGRLPSRTTIAEQLPARALRMDLASGSSLILAVVPFQQIAIGMSLSAEAS